MNAKNKISWKKVKELEEIKQRINDLYEKLEEEEKKLFKKYGEYEEVFEIEPDSDNCKYLRFRIVDNVKKLNEKGACFKVASFKPIDIELKRLKRKPAA